MSPAQTLLTQGQGQCPGQKWVDDQVLGMGGWCGGLLQLWNRGWQAPQDPTSALGKALTLWGFGFLSPHSEGSGWTLSKDTAMSQGSFSSQVHCQPRLVEFTIRRGRGTDVNCHPRESQTNHSFVKLFLSPSSACFPVLCFGTKIDP